MCEQRSGKDAGACEQIRRPLLSGNRFQSERLDLHRLQREIRRPYQHVLGRVGQFFAGNQPGPDFRARIFRNEHRSIVESFGVGAGWDVGQIGLKPRANAGYRRELLVTGSADTNFCSGRNDDQSSRQRKAG
jgi:hypothetical protein